MLSPVPCPACNCVAPCCVKVPSFSLLIAWPAALCEGDALRLLQSQSAGRGFCPPVPLLALPAGQFHLPLALLAQRARQRQSARRHGSRSPAPSSPARCPVSRPAT